MISLSPHKYSYEIGTFGKGIFRRGKIFVKIHAPASGEDRTTLTTHFFLLLSI